MTETLTPAQTFVISDSGADQDVPLVVQQFDPSLGTLRGVVLTATIDVGGSLEVENLATIAGTITAGLGATLNISLPGDPAPVSFSNTASESAMLAADGVSGSGMTWTGLSSTGQSSDEVFAPPEMIGTGTVTLDGALSLSSFFDGSGSFEGLSGAVGGATISLQYDFSPPGTGGGSGEQFDLPPLPITGTAETTPQTVTLSDETTGWTQDAVFQQFDPTLGTLGTVQLVFRAGLSGSVAAENLMSSAGMVVWDQGGMLSLDGQYATGYANADVNNIGSLGLGAFDGSADFGGASGFTDNGITALGDQTTINIDDPSLLAAFIGTGTFGVPFDGTGFNNVNGPGSLSLLAQLLIGGEVTLTYFYDPIACFADGTRIATPAGDRPVEELCVGDAVLTHGGRHAPVRWVGRRRVECARHARPETVFPVRVRAHAFGPGLPRRDLVLSPDHALFLDDVLIPVRCLLGTEAIVQERWGAVTYHHVELDRHDILLAEGLPAESFLDAGSRHAFEGGVALQVHPAFAATAWEMAAAPLVVDGPVVQAVRARLLAFSHNAVMATRMN